MQNERNCMKKILILTIIVSFISFTYSCETIQKNTTLITSTLTGCALGGAAGALMDAAANKGSGNPIKDLQDSVKNGFKKKKASNKNAIVGLGAGCLAGLGVGFYLQTMKDDMAENLRKDGIDVEEVKDDKGETVELLLKLKDKAVSFQSGSANLNSTSKEKVTRIGEVLKEYPEARVKVHGHSSADGKADINMKLSNDRALTVKKEMTQAGLIDGNVIEAKGFGSEKPLPKVKATSADNRRVEIRVVAAK